MTYKINGTEITIQPTQGRWLAKDELGIDGAGHPIYPMPREFELRWGVVSPSEANQLQTFFETVITTGTAVVDLPMYANATYVFFSYSGCTLTEPEWGRYFAEYYNDAVVIVRNIRT
jgi:hypothetical protein